MPKSIYDRVRATLAANERKRQLLANTADAKLQYASRRRMAADARRDARLDALIAGTVEPKNAREWDIVNRAEFGDY